MSNPTGVTASEKLAQLRQMEKLAQLRKMEKLAADCRDWVTLGYAQSCISEILYKMSKGIK